MFGFFKRKKSEEDPLSDLKTVSRWMQELPAGDIYTAQEQVVQSLIQFNHAGLAMSKERLQVLMHLDEQARDMQYSLCLQYLRNPRMSKVIESRLWTAIHAFYWEVTRGYHSFVMDFVAHPGGSKIQPMIPLIAARALRGFADIFKWRYFRYERVEEKLWQRMHNLYRIAEFDSFQGNRFKLYDNDYKPSSCVDEYIQALLLSPLGTGSLTPKQLEMIDQWLDHWSVHSNLDSQYDPSRHFFFVDFAQGHPLKRIRDQITPESGQRFLNIQALLDHITQVEEQLRTGTPPATLGLGEDFRLPDGYDLLHYASNEWAPVNDRDRRIAPREPVAGHCEVLRDLPNICHRLEQEQEIVDGAHAQHQLSPEEILDIKLYGFVTERTKSTLFQRSQSHRDLSAEQWSMHDRSETGIGILVKNEDSEWVKVGKLLAMRLDPAHHWLVGIVRRLTRTPQDMRKIGVQTFDSKPVQVFLDQEASTAPLSYSVDDTGFDNAPPIQAVIFEGEQPENLIILEGSRYAHGRHYRLREPKGMHRIRLDSVRDKGDGWIMATFTFQA